MWPVIRYSFTEPLRNPWTLIGLIGFAGLLTLVLALNVSEGFAEADDFEVVDVLNATGFFSFTLAFILGFGLVSQEIALGTIQLGLLRPIPRWKYFAARLTGRMVLLAALFSTMVVFFEVYSALRHFDFYASRVIQWAGVLLMAESVILLLGVLGTVTSRFGGSITYGLLWFLFLQWDVFLADRPDTTLWHGVAKVVDGLKTLVLGIPEKYLLESPDYWWHTLRLFAVWLAHAAFLFTLGAILFKRRELGARP